jgi:hypothetical protein
MPALTFEDITDRFSAFFSNTEETPLAIQSPQAHSSFLKKWERLLVDQKGAPSMARDTETGPDSDLKRTAQSLAALIGQTPHTAFMFSTTPEFRDVMKKGSDPAFLTVLQNTPVEVDAVRRQQWYGLKSHENPSLWDAIKDMPQYPFRTHQEGHESQARAWNAFSNQMERTAFIHYAQNSGDDPSVIYSQKNTDRFCQTLVSQGVTCPWDEVRDFLKSVPEDIKPRFFAQILTTEVSHKRPDGETYAGKITRNADEGWREWFKGEARQNAHLFEIMSLKQGNTLYREEASAFLKGDFPPERTQGLFDLPPTSMAVREMAKIARDIPVEVVQAAFQKAAEYATARGTPITVADHPVFKAIVPKGAELENAQALKNEAPTPAPTPASSMAKPASYHLAVQGKTYGPFEAEKVTEMIKNGQIALKDTQAWRPGMASWEKLETLKDLHPVAARPIVIPETHPLPTKPTDADPSLVTPVSKPTPSRPRMRV